MKREFLEGSEGSVDIGLREPENAKMVGAIAMAWSNLESGLSLYYATLVIGTHGAFHEAQAIMIESFDAVESIHQKLGRRKPPRPSGGLQVYPVFRRVPAEGDRRTG